MDLKPPAPSQQTDDAPAGPAAPAVSNDVPQDAAAASGPVQTDSSTGSSVDDQMQQVSDMFNNPTPGQDLTADPTVEAAEAAVTAADPAAATPISDPAAPPSADPLASLTAVPDSTANPADPAAAWPAASTPADSMAATGNDPSVPAPPMADSATPAPIDPASPDTPAATSTGDPSGAMPVGDPAPAADPSIFTQSTPAASDVTPAVDMSAGVPPAAPTGPGFMNPDAAVVTPVIGGMAAGSVKKSKGKWLAKAVVAVGAAVVLFGGSAAAYFGYVVPNKPENILKAALFNSFAGEDGTKSVYLDGEFNVTDKASDMELGGTLGGKFGDGGAFDVNAEVDVLVTKLKVEARSVDGKSYFVKLSGLDGLPELLSTYGADPSYASVLTSLNDQWMEINESLIKQLTKEDPTSLSDADLQKLADIYARHSFLKIAKTFDDADIKGMKSHHYRVVLDKTELKATYQEIKDAKIKGFTITQEELDSFNDMIKNADFDKYPFEVWIDKKTKIIDQITFSLDQSDAKGSLRLTFFDFGKPVTVEKPTGAKSILEVISQLSSAFSGSFSGSSSGGTPEDMFLQDLQQSGSGISL